MIPFEKLAWNEFVPRLSKLFEPVQKAEIVDIERSFSVFMWRFFKPDSEGSQGIPDGVFLALLSDGQTAKVAGRVIVSAADSVTVTQPSTSKGIRWSELMREFWPTKRLRRRSKTK